MKPLFFGLVFGLLSTVAFGNEQTAEELFRARGENPQNAYKSFELYTNLARTAPTADEQAQNYFLASQSVYYVGSKSTDNSSRKKYHELPAQPGMVECS